MADDTVNATPKDIEEPFVPVCPEWDYCTLTVDSPLKIPNALIQMQAHGYQLDRIYFGMNGSDLNPMPCHIVLGRRKFDKSKWNVQIEQPKVVL